MEQSQNKPSKTIEDYLQVMHYMTRDGSTIIGARLAERIHVAPPTVTVTLQRMVKQGLVTMDAHKIVHLTELGREQAESIVRRHALAERLLTDILGLGWSESHEEAHLVEHVISPKVEQHLMRVLGDPMTCPHGNPIPGTAYEAPITVALSELTVGDRFTVTRIPEELEFTPGLLEFLEDASIQPGHSGAVTASSPDGTTTVEIDGHHVGIGTFASTRILVTAGR
jgi:DtxR family Mn-dependent transcriptional regulator